MLMKDPHELLGLHEIQGGKVIRLWRPGATDAALEVRGKVHQAKAVDTAGLLSWRLMHRLAQLIIASRIHLVLKQTIPTRFSQLFLRRMSIFLHSESIKNSLR